MAIESKECFTGLTLDGQLFEILQAVGAGGSGTVTSIVAGTGLNGGTITTSGTISVKYGTTAATAAQGDDARLSDARIPTGSAGGDLNGTYPSPTVDGLQGNPVSNTAPSSGQVLQWNGTAWTPGVIPSGGSGGGGLFYFFNYQNTTGISPTTGLPSSPVPVSQFGRTYSVGAGSITSADLTNGSYSLICGFVTQAADPGVTEIPAGLWDFNIWADVLGGSGLSNQTQFQVRVYKYDSIGGTYTSLANSDDVYVYDPVTIAQYIANVTMPQTTILATDRIYVELWAQKNVNQSRQIRFYFDSLRPSHGHTTLPSVSGSGVVKVVNGVFQSPASTIVDVDVSASAAIAQSKIANLTSDLLGKAGTSNIQTFTSSTNWNKPAGAKSVNIQLFGAGAGGGGGRKGTAALTAKSGGAGGGGGSYLNITVPASVLGASESVVIGAGGTGGAGSAVDGNGAAGNVGGSTTFGLFICHGGNGGGGGSTVPSTGGLGVLNANGGAGSNVITGGGTGVPSTASSLTQYGGAGGGGGGGISVASAPFAGGAGGRSNVLNLNGGTLGSNTGQAGGAGINNTSATTGLFAVGSGGGGGGAGLAVSGGDGGAGGFPASGGGGGGPTESGTTSGVGGLGANGLAIITTYF